MDRLVNETVVGALNARLNLRKIACHMRGCDYRPARFTAAIIRMRHAQHRVSVLLFPNGRLVCCGSRGDARAVIKRVRQRLARIGVRTQLRDLRCVNQVYAGQVPHSIDLPLLADSTTGTYDPELFSGAKLPLCGATVIVFRSGKYFITGVRSYDPALVDTLHSVLWLFQQ